MTSDPHRLPSTVVPSRYVLELAPDLDAARFDGRVDIDVTVREPVDEIVLNGLELTIHTAGIEQGGGRREAAPTTDDRAERITLALDDPLEVGEARVRLEFSGVLNDKLVGFYRSTFTDDDGVEHTLATSQMEATHARQAFPCWDEPAAKAVFEVVLVVDDDHVAVSNGAEIGSETLGDGRRRVRFAPTIPMSTYLVAFLVGPLEITTGPDVDGVPLRVIHPPGQAHLADFALEVGGFALAHLAGYYDIAYPGDKLDLAAVPDFAFGAMENLGLVIFRETLLLIDPRTATREELERAVDVIAHEIAHMWFGDLVTMRWWNGIWLNEAFATFVEMLTTDAYRPDWKRWASFGVSRAAAFDTDALTTTRPIEFEVTSPDQAEAMFDVLTYEKGASVVRMLEQFVGPEPFRAGIEHYLRTHELGNTETSDLWDAIETTTDVAVRELMDTWIFQGGFPALTVDRDGADVVIAQQRFTYLPAEPSEWLVPAIVTVRRNGATTVDKVVVGSDPVRIAGAADADVVFANTGASGFYRTRYDDALAHRLASGALDHLDEVERFVLVDDTWAFLTRGDVDPEGFLQLAEALTAERDLSVWRALLAGLGTLLDDLDEHAARLRPRVRAVVEPLTADLGWSGAPGEPDTASELRARVLEFASTALDDEDVRDRLRSLETDDPALVAAAERVRGEFADDGDFEALAERYRRAPTPQEQLRALYALTAARDGGVHARLLELVLDSGEVRTQNEPFVIARMLTNRRHAASTWAAVESRWDALMSRLASSTVPRMLEGVRSVADPALAERIDAFLEAHPLSDPLKVAQHRERMRVTVARARRVRASLG